MTRVSTKRKITVILPLEKKGKFAFDFVPDIRFALTHSSSSSSFLSLDCLRIVCSFLGFQSYNKLFYFGYTQKDIHTILWSRQIWKSYELICCITFVFMAELAGDPDICIRLPYRIVSRRA